MKKLFALLLSVSLLTACNSEPKKDYPVRTLTYRVYYPGNTVEKTFTSKIKNYWISSHRGSNYITVKNENGYEDVINTSAPIEIISVK